MPAVVRSGAILLVGAFDDVRTLRRARREFAAAFAAGDFVCIPAEEPQPAAGFWDEFCASILRAIGDHPGKEQVETIDAPESVRNSMRQILSSGGGLVLVRTMERLPQACHIIQTSGGRVGFS